MSETPLPQSVSDFPDERSGAGDFRPRKRSHTGPNRTVTPFTAGANNGHRDSEPAPEPQSEELAFAGALRAVGIAKELSDDEVRKLAPSIASSDPRTRRTDVLVAYYEAQGDPLTAQRRQATDRWFLYCAGDGLTAPQLLSRLLNVVPELSGAELERLGGRNGTLVLRAGDDVCALEDEREEPSGPTISVCDLVRAVNVLLDRRLVRARIVGLLGDGMREAYVGLPSATAAIALSSADYLAAPDAEALLDLTGW